MTSDRESGATLIMVAISVFVLAGMAALALDVAQLRGDRIANQAHTDFAATAAAIALSESGPQSACETAVSYVEANIGDATAFTTIDCAAFPPTCDAATAAVTQTGSSGRYELSLVYPVEDASSLMQPAAVSASQPLHADDGGRCERIAVQLKANHDSFFAGVVGVGSSATQVHSVAKPAVAAGGSQAINLLILERHDCKAVNVANSGGYGVVVGSVTDPDTGGVFPGVLAIDSDGTTNCAGTGTLYLQGSGSGVRADGPAGCADETVPGTGQGCGTISLFAPGVPGCNPPACVSAGVLEPAPGVLPKRITRAPIDHRYNCKPAYPVPFDIEGCSGSADPNIDQLHAALGGPGPPAGYSSYSAAGYPCTEVISPTVIPAGNWYVDCAVSIKDPLVFTGGNVVFASSVAIESDGVLAVNALAGTYDPASPSAVAYLRAGAAVTKTGQAGLRFKNTTVILDNGASVTMDGGSGALEWIAPVTGDLEDLALWSDSTLLHRFAGQAVMDLEGVFFVPHATVQYQGNGLQQQVAAQFVARKLDVGGNGALMVSPTMDRAVLFGGVRASLIR